ncbi:PQQ-dependent sugar dehydrogenase [Brevundimonas lenta]|uniref:Glucose/arabinose dehydrogenase n=1 Tax=Brevundimonas lenta TaxID=424796 RepID=A0A7W6JCA1_9CAUL|nr:PQQ-dependent sugar dehydrogenase [Brevundimonas lenta]MBB4081526.1 glucose/arabinose dehydrogenase [Brevundimonas lenta]
MIGWRAILAAAALFGLAPPAAGQQASRAYAVEGDCGGRPATQVRMAEGYCLGRVWQRTGDEGPRMPRGLLELTNGDWLVTDLGGWEAGRGALWRLSLQPDGAVRWTRLMDRLSMPHTIAKGPDGRVYLAEMSRIIAFDPARPDRAVAVVEGLPDNRLHENRHPLSSFVFDGDGALLVNVGAPSDRCLDAREAPRRDARGRCVEEAEQGMVRRYAPAGNGRWSAEWRPYATGLRNSVAMVRHPAGAIFQAENSVDLNEPGRPYDEINRLQSGRHYGWPYCTDMRTPMPGWTAAEARCDQRTAPVSLLPPHAAPLAMLYYDGAMFPELRGRLLMSWHGYRRAAGRVVALETDWSGAPLTATRALYAIYPRGALAYPADAPAPQGKVLTPGWSAQAGRHPQGSPAGLAVARDGSIWIADDRAAAILRIARP